MILTTVLLTLKLLAVYVEPADPLERDDQTLATCVVDALTSRPSALTIAPTRETADVVLTVVNDAKFRLHVKGKLVAADGRLLAEADHVQKGFNRKLCHQADGMMAQLAKKLSKSR
jgi:hypothetical protein